MFNNPPNRSEALVLDGIQRAMQVGRADAPLGRYIRAGDARWPDALQQRELFRRQDRSGEFRPYQSQFGLQGMGWIALHRIASPDARTMESLNAALMAGVVAAVFVWCTRRFGAPAAWIGAATLFLSPWPVLFARDLYWVAFTLFLPMLVMLYAGQRLYDRSGPRLAVLALFGAAVATKLLCGYEYLTTLVIAGLFPVVFHGLTLRRPPREIVTRLFQAGLVSVAAFALALVLHLHRLGVSDPEANTGSALDYVVSVAQKRLHSSNPEEVAREVCNEDFWRDDNCVPVFVESLRANPVTVVGQYVAFRYMLPWLARLEEGEVSAADRTALRDRLQAVPASRRLSVLADTPLVTLQPWIVRGTNTLVFLAICLAAALKLRASRNAGMLVALPVLAVCVAAPLSWFIAAKGHSYLHTTMNYVLWYLPMLPAMLIYLAIDARTCAPRSRRRRSGQPRISSDHRMTPT
ncbi:MAG TPA: hypothetical protein PKA20_14975 [Burkholderiaceae bacterium]|nr:hypothetical protein [Burkholderiaceae bacterium]